VKRFILSILALMLIFGLSGCNDDKNLKGLISEFQKNKIEGTFERRAAAASVGAIDGYSYEGKGRSFY